jgi:hypothetical protein
LKDRNSHSRLKSPLFEVCHIELLLECVPFGGPLFLLWLQVATAVPTEFDDRDFPISNSSLPNPLELFLLSTRTYASQEIIAEQIQCYNLPYSGLGFLSHSLTYYTIVCMGFSARPLAPWVQTSSSCRKWNGFLSVAQLLASNIVAIITIYRCRQDWPFILIAVWHAVLSSTLVCMAIHRVRLAAGDEEDDYSPFGWLGLYALGVIVRLVGVFASVKEVWEIQGVRDMTGAVHWWLHCACYGNHLWGEILL